jgi:NAD(P)-dependent dehydrogenase (short-subunit alcohol dehydrogenase family)
MYIDPVHDPAARFGRLDVAVNNAGTEGVVGSAADVTLENYRSIFRHQRAWCTAGHELRNSGYASQGKGSIVNISSAHGKIGGPTAANLFGQQACARRRHELGGHRTRRNRCSDQHRGPWAD